MCSYGHQMCIDTVYVSCELGIKVTGVCVCCLSYEHKRHAFLYGCQFVCTCSCEHVLVTWIGVCHFLNMG